MFYNVLLLFESQLPIAISKRCLQGLKELGYSSGPRGGGWGKEGISEGTEGQGEEERGLGRRGGLGRRKKYLESEI
jgi:hypothetical protein